MEKKSTFFKKKLSESFLVNGGHGTITVVSGLYSDCSTLLDKKLNVAGKPIYYTN